MYFLQVKETISQLKSRFQESLADKDDISKRQIENLQKQAEKGLLFVMNSFLFHLYEKFICRTTP